MKSGLTITTSTDANVQILHLAGFLDGNTFVELERRLTDLLQAKHLRIVLELSKLTYIASAGVGCFIASAQKWKTAGGNLQLATPSPNVGEVFAILGLEQVFTIHRDLAAAVATAKH